MTLRTLDLEFRVPLVYATPSFLSNGSIFRVVSSDHDKVSFNNACFRDFDLLWKPYSTTSPIAWNCPMTTLTKSPRFTLRPGFEKAIQ
jgi:hypothetical protein